MVNHRQKTHCLKKLMHYFVLKRNEWTDKNQIMDPYPHFTTWQIVPRPLPFVPGVILAGLKPDGYSFNFGIGGICEGGSRRCTNSHSAGSRDISKSRGWTWYGLLENLWSKLIGLIYQTIKSYLGYFQEVSYSWLTDPKVHQTDAKNRFSFNVYLACPNLATYFWKLSRSSSGSWWIPFTGSNEKCSVLLLPMTFFSSSSSQYQMGST